MKTFYQPIVDFSNKGWWQKLVVLTVIVAGIGTADHYLGNGNLVTGVLTQVEQTINGVSPTTVQ